MKIPREIVFLMALLVFGCGGRPEIRYYQLAPPPSAGDPTGSDVVLSVDTFVGDAAYEDNRIVYRKSPTRLDYYHYHRWTAPPGVMLGDFLRGAYESTGHFRTVVSGFSPEAPLYLGGRIVAFEEVDVDESTWRARAVLALYLRETKTGDIVWSETITEEEPVDEQNPDGVARAMSRAVMRVVERTAPEFAAIARNVRARNERARSRDDALKELGAPDVDE